MINRTRFPLCFAWILTLTLLGLGCGATLDDFNAPDAQVDGSTSPDGAGSDAATGPVLEIYVVGDASEREIDDGLSGQTPQNYVMQLQRFDVMTSADDASPVPIFDHGAHPVEVDLLGRTLAGSAPIASLPEGTYTHGRVKLVSASFDVDATVHAMGNNLPGTISVFVALSDFNDGTRDWSLGQAEYTFSLYPTPVAAVIPAFPSTPAGQVVQKDGETWLVFAFDQPITLTSQFDRDLSVSVVFEVSDSFRWEDQDEPEYTDGVFDTTAVTYEPVRNFGATGYRFEYE